MTENSNHSLKGDRALGAGDDDRLGFREVAKQIAVSLVGRNTEDGLVVGLQGAWGQENRAFCSLLMTNSDNYTKIVSLRSSFSTVADRQPRRAYPKPVW